MKKLLLSAAALCCFASAQAQWQFQLSNTKLYSEGASNSIEWRHSASGSGYGHRFYGVDLGNGMTQLRLGYRGLSATSWTDMATFTSYGDVGIGTTDPKAKFQVYNSVGAGTAVGNFKLISRIGSANTTVGGNVINQNLFLRRDAAGDSWATIRFHDAVSVDGSYLTPGVDTKTWWERDPWDDIQSWGSGNNTYLTIRQGNVGIGTTNPGTYKLAVEGKAGAREVVVTTAPWADYVFASNYKLRPLSEVAKFIEENKHLPEVPTAAEIEKNGNNLGATDALLLKKIEELTLYVIEQNKKLEAQQKQLQEVKEENQELKKEVQKLK